MQHLRRDKRVQLMARIVSLSSAAGPVRKGPLSPGAASGIELIFGTRRVAPTAVRRIAGGFQADLRGDALLALLDLTFQGPAQVEMLGCGMDLRPLEVTEIEMHGNSTTVTLLCAGEAPLLN